MRFRRIFARILIIIRNTRKFTLFRHKNPIIGMIYISCQKGPLRNDL